MNAALSDQALARSILSRRRVGEPSVGRPWIEPPADHEPFDITGSVACPAAGTTDTQVISLRCPYGYQGVLLGVGHRYIGTGFVEGSGDILWSVRVGGRFPNGYGAINISLGSAEQSRPVFGAIRFYENELIEYLVTVPAASPIATGAPNYMIAMLAGYTWPAQRNEEAA